MAAESWYYAIGCMDAKVRATSNGGDNFFAIERDANLFYRGFPCTWMKGDLLNKNLPTDFIERGAYKNKNTARSPEKLVETRQLW
ncbi:4795_t:CDS:2 [Acaulospora colombiana]|uniref:4795_t:CDS:1 n=1 Tax=Acaulospora colombiana TaxID=27376 RepID=A0ACA9L0S0_9GLOM|nr:4795_t:CDS:2 [Acaulospora colombiana]